MGLETSGSGAQVQPVPVQQETFTFTDEFGTYHVTVTCIGVVRTPGTRGESRWHYHISGPFETTASGYKSYTADMPAKDVAYFAYRGM